MHGCTPFGDAWGAPFGDTLDTFLATSRESAPRRWGPSLVMHGALPFGDAWGAPFGDTSDTFLALPGNRSASVGAEFGDAWGHPISGCLGEFHLGRLRTPFYHLPGIDPRRWGP